MGHGFASGPRGLSLLALVATLLVGGCGSSYRVSEDVTDDTRFHGDYQPGRSYQLRRDVYLVDWSLTDHEGEQPPVGRRFALYSMHEPAVPQRAVIGIIPAHTLMVLDHIRFEKFPGLRVTPETVPVAKLSSGDHAGKLVSLVGLSTVWVRPEGKVHRWNPDWLLERDLD